MTWHADQHTIARYAAGSLPMPAASSLEAHLVDCEQCRSTVPAQPDRHERMWLEIVDRADEPAPRPVERLLRLLGVGAPTARLLSVTPSLTLSWFAAVAVVLGFAVLAAHGGSNDGGLALFLVLAPIVPVAGVAVAFGRTFDPAHEITSATPMSGLRLLLVRSAAVVTTSAVLAGAAGLALPAAGGEAAAWLLPALALTVATMGLAAVVSPVQALSVVGLGWFGVCASAFVLSARGAGGLPATGDHYVGLDPVGQAALVLLALGGLALLVRRRHQIAATA